MDGALWICCQSFLIMLYCAIVMVLISDSAYSRKLWWDKIFA